MVEHNLAKVGVASSSLVFRSREVIGNGGLFSYVSRLCRDTFVYISELGGSNEVVVPFRPVLGLEAEYRGIRRKEGDSGGMFYTMFNTERQYL